MWKQYRCKNGLVVILSGPSGVGKDSVLEELLRLRTGVVKCTTYTTRPRRQNEQDASDYNFVTVEQFREMVERDEFLEWAEVHRNFYGTPRAWVNENSKAGRDVILKIDVQGGIAVQRQIPESIMVFLAPPSVEELERRLRSRVTENEEQITRRLLDARSELLYIPCYEYLIVNDTVQQSADELRSIIIGERNRIQREA